MAMMDWFELVRAAGIDAKKLDPMTVHQLGGNIIHDPVVKERKMKYLGTGECRSVLPADSPLKVVREMTEFEREGLRQRILI